MNSVIDDIRLHALRTPHRVAVIHGTETLTYSALLHAMESGGALPLPLLGSSWRGDFILHTTGTTGRSKGVVISQRAVAANTDNLIKGHGYSADTVFIIAGDMTHLGCWSKIFPVLCSGGTLLLLDNGMRDMEAFFSALDLRPGDYGLSPDSRFATFLVPSAIRMLLQMSGERLARYADRVDFIETGAAPMPQSDMLRLCELLPHSRLYNTYASTETGVVATYNYNDGRCMAGCLGRPLPHSRVVITPEGRIACQGDTLMTRYTDPEAPHCDGIFVTNDNGYFDADGMLHITGRADDIINVGGYKVSPVEIENCVLALPTVRDCICVPMPHPVMGQAPHLIVVPEKGCTMNSRDIARHIADAMERYKVPLRYTEADEIARTPNGKPDRKHYIKS